MQNPNPVSLFRAFFFFFICASLAAPLSIAESNEKITAAKKPAPEPDLDDTDHMVMITLYQAMKQARPKKLYADGVVNSFRGELRRTKSPNSAQEMAMRMAKFGNERQRDVESYYTHEERMRALAEGADDAVFGGGGEFVKSLLPEEAAPYIAGITYINGIYKAVSAYRDASGRPINFSQLSSDPDLAARLLGTGGGDDFTPQLVYDGQSFPLLSLYEFEQIYKEVSQIRGGRDSFMRLFQIHFDVTPPAGATHDDFVKANNHLLVPEMAMEARNIAKNLKKDFENFTKAQKERDEAQRKRIDALNKIAEEHTAKLDEINGKVDGLTQAYSKNEDRLKEIEKELEQARKDRDAQKEAELKVEQARAELARQMIQNQIDERRKKERLWLYESTATALQQVGIFVGDPKFKKMTSQFGRFLGLVHSFELLQDRVPTSLPGEFALGMDYVTIALAFMNLFGPEEPNPTEIILKQMEAFADHVDKRFDRLEMIQGEYQKEIRANFKAMHVALKDLKDGIADAQVRLAEIQRGINALSRKIDDWRADDRSRNNQQRWSALESHRGNYLTWHVGHGQNYTHDVMLEGFKAFLDQALEGGKDEIFIGRQANVDNAETKGKAVATVVGFADPMEKVDLLLRMGRFYDLEFKASERIRNASFWVKASDSYLELLKANGQHMFTIDSTAAVDTLIGIGEDISDALDAGRSPQRIGAIVKAQDTLYQRTLGSIIAKWAAWTLEYEFLKNDGTLAVTAEDLAKLFVVKGKGAELEKAKQSLSEAYPVEEIPRGSWRVVIDGEELEKVIEGAKLFPPALRALMLAVRRSKPQLDDRRVTIKPKIVSWKSLPTGSPEFIRRLPLVEFSLSTPQMEQPFTVQMTVDALFDIQQIAKVDKNSGEVIEVLPEKDKSAEMMKVLSANWDGILAAELKETPNPWRLDPTPALAPLIAQMKVLRRDFAKDLKVAVATTPEKVQEQTVSKYLDTDTRKDLSKVGTELSAEYQVLAQHLVTFAPDFLFAQKAKEPFMWLDDNVPSVKAAFDSIDFIVTQADDGKSIDLKKDVAHLKLKAGAEFRTLYQIYSEETKFNPTAAVVNQTIQNLKKGRSLAMFIVDVNQETKRLSQAVGAKAD
jgi:hypothetical protein